jgi:hypothetical protein
MREAMHDGRARHRSEDARGEAGRMPEARQGGCARQGRADARGKAG